MEREKMKSKHALLSNVEHQPWAGERKSANSLKLGVKVNGYTNRDRQKKISSATLWTPKRTGKKFQKEGEGGKLSGYNHQ